MSKLNLIINDQFFEKVRNKILKAKIRNNKKILNLGSANILKEKEIKMFNSRHSHIKTKKGKVYWY